MLFMIYNGPLPNYILGEDKLMDGEHHPGDVAEEEHGHDAAQHQGKVSLSSARLASTQVGEPASKRIGKCRISTRVE